MSSKVRTKAFHTGETIPVEILSFIEECRPDCLWFAKEAPPENRREAINLLTSISTTGNFIQYKKSHGIHSMSLTDLQKEGSFSF